MSPDTLAVIMTDIKYCARHDTEHMYTQVHGFEPHSWVVQACKYAYLLGRHDGMREATVNGD